MSRARTVVFVHAHPDDEVFLTGGTMARLAAEGHRVVLVTATNGERGLAAGHVEDDGDLGAVRARELTRASEALGCSEVYLLGYPDSGLSPDCDDAGAFSRLQVEHVAARLAAILDALGADLVCGYDSAGGYGHPDHIQVHHVTRRAAQLARTPRLLEATVNRRALQAVLRLAAPLLPAASQYQAATLEGRFASPAEITHSIRVGRYVSAKRKALEEHASQATGGSEERLASLLLRLPRPVFSLVLGHEWFIEAGRGGHHATARQFFADRC